MQEKQMNKNGKSNILKLVVFGFLAFVALLTTSLALFLGPIIGPLLFPSPGQKEMVQAQEVWNEDRSKAESIMKGAIKKAEEAHAPTPELMQMHRNYAQCLYNSQDYPAGDAQISEAIALCLQPPQANSKEADQLTHAYQDRGWSTFNHHLADPTAGFGDKDQEKSVEVAEKYFGANHEQTIYKVPSLALIYSEMGLKEKAQKTMQRALDAVKNNKDSARECAWYVYGSDARMKAAERDYKPALVSFLQGMKFAGSNENQSNRIWDDFSAEISRQSSKDNSSSERPELKDVRSLFEHGKFEQLDKIADQLQKEELTNWDGTWLLDTFFVNILDDDNSSDQDFQQRLFDVKTWIKKNPKSATAKVALAHTLADYAWFARGSGYADSVSPQGWKQFESRLVQAKSALDADPSTKRNCPRAFRIYSRLATGQGMEKSDYKKLLDECHTTWPRYYTIDIGACTYFLPRWHGEPNETEEYIQSRADSINGSMGDKLYAQLVWDQRGYLDNLFTKKSIIKWSRVKAGFKQIFKDFPKDLNARVAFIQLCRDANDAQSVELAFDGYKPQ